MPILSPDHATILLREATSLSRKRKCAPHDMSARGLDEMGCDRAKLEAWPNRRVLRIAEMEGVLSRGEPA